MKEHLNEKIQVLISKEDLRQLNEIILNNALNSGERPISLSMFVRNLLKQEIQRYHENKNKPQKSFIEEDIKNLQKKNKKIK